MKELSLLKKAEILRNAEESASDVDNDNESEKNLSELRVKNWQISTIRAENVVPTTIAVATGPESTKSKTNEDHLGRANFEAADMTINNKGNEIRINVDNNVVHKQPDNNDVAATTTVDLRVNSAETTENEMSTMISREALSARQTRDNLPTFDGSSRKWPTFYAAYVNSTKICQFNNHENLMRLEISLKKSAYTAAPWKAY